MNDSSEPVETSSTRTPSTGCSRSSRASSSSTATAVRLSLAPGTTVRVAMSPNASRLPAETTRPSLRSARDRGERRPGGDEPQHLGRGRLLRVPARERVGDQAGQLRPVDQAALRGVVVGDEHQRLLRTRIAGLPDDVVGRAVLEQAAEDVRAAGDVVDDARRRQQPERRQPPPAERRQPPRRPTAAPSGIAIEPTADSSSTRAGTPSASSSPRIHSAARRSPSEAEGRSNEARCSTVARSRAVSAGMDRPG